MLILNGVTIAFPDEFWLCGQGAANVFRHVQRADAIKVSIGNVATVPTKILYSRERHVVFIRLRKKQLSAKLVEIFCGHAKLRERGFLRTYGARNGPVSFFVREGMDESKPLQNNFEF